MDKTDGCTIVNECICTVLYCAVREERSYGTIVRNDRSGSGGGGCGYGDVGVTIRVFVSIWTSVCFVNDPHLYGTIVKE